MAGASASPNVADQSASGQQTTGWYYLDNQGQHVGPFTTQQLQAYHVSGYVPPETLVWAEGRPEWQQLQQVEELAKALISASTSAAAADTPAPDVRQVVNAVQSAASAATAQAAAAKPAGASKAATVAAAPTQLDPLAAFKGEISAIEAENEEQPPSPAEKMFVDDDGTAYEWDSQARRFVESGTAAASAPAAAQYDIADMTFTVDDEAQPPMPAAEAQDSDEDAAGGGGPDGTGHKADKRKLEEAVEREMAKKLKAKEDADKKAAWFELKKNSSVYITGLPLDAAEAELVKVFTKCGVIKLDDDRRPRVRVYRDEDGTGKGDGLVTYLKEPSVDLALQILHGAPLRDGDSQPMSVTKAEFQQKGDFVNKKRAPKKRKKKVLENQEERELGWGGFDDVAPATKTTVVLRHMFHPSEFEEDFTLREQLDDDVTAETAKLGKVEKVKTYNTNPQGVVTVKFREEDAALQCIQVMHGRFFGGRQIEAAMWDGIEQFWVKPEKKKETEEEQQARLEKYAAELEAAEAPSSEAPPAAAAMTEM